MNPGVIVIKQWKRPKTIYRSLSYLNWKHKNGFSHEEIFKVANSRLGWYKRSGMNVVNELYPLSRTFLNLSTHIFRHDFFSVSCLIDRLYFQYL